MYMRFLVVFVYYYATFQNLPNHPEYASTPSSVRN